MEINGKFGVEIKDSGGNTVEKIESPNTVVNGGILQVKRWLDRNEVVLASPDHSTPGEGIYCAAESRRITLAPDDFLDFTGSNAKDSDYSPYRNAFDGFSQSRFRHWHDSDQWRNLDYTFADPINLKQIGLIFYADINSSWSHATNMVAYKPEGYSISGAGTAGYNTNEFIREFDDYNGYHVYKEDDTEFYIFTDVGGTKWQMSTSIGGSIDYETDDASMPEKPSDGNWIVVNGAANAPTVSEGTERWRFPYYKEGTDRNGVTTDTHYHRGMSYCDDYSEERVLFDETDDNYIGNRRYVILSFEGVKGLRPGRPMSWYGFIPFVKTIRMDGYVNTNYDGNMNFQEIHIYEANMHPQNPYALKLGSDDGTILPLDVTNAALGAESSNMEWKCDDVGQTTGYTVRFSKSLAPEVANNTTFNEIGLFGNLEGHIAGTIGEPTLDNADGLFARSIFDTSWSKTEDQTATIYYEITVS